MKEEKREAVDTGEFMTKLRGGGLLLNRKKKDMIFFLLNRSGRKGGVADVGERRNTCKCKVFEWAKVERIKTA